MGAKSVQDAVALVARLGESGHDYHRERTIEERKEIHFHNIDAI